MIVIAILLLVAIAAVTAGVVAGSEEDAVLDIFGETVRAAGWEIFVVGAACGVALPIALWLLRAGTRRAAVRRRQTRELRAATERERAELARQREELEAERSTLRSGGLVRPYVGTGAPGDGGPDEARAPDRTTDRAPGDGVTPERAGSPPSRDPDRDRLTGEGDQPSARFEVQRPGARPAGFGSQSSGLGPPPGTDLGSGGLSRPPRP